MRDKYNLNIAVLGPDGEPIDVGKSATLNCIVKARNCVVKARIV